MIGPTEKDTRELRTFKRYLSEVSTHKQLERTVGKRLPMETATVPRDWWDPRGEFRRAPDTKEEGQS